MLGFGFEESCGPGSHRRATKTPSEFLTAVNSSEHLLADSSGSTNGFGEVERQLPVATSLDRLPELLAISRVDLDALPPARNGDIPLLRVSGCPHPRIGEEDVIDGLPLRAVGCHRVAALELPVVQRAACVRHPVGSSHPAERPKR